MMIMMINDYESNDDNGSNDDIEIKDGYNINDD